MKNKQIIFVAIIAAMLGLGAGYILFNKSHDHPPASSAAIQSEDNSAGEASTWICSMHPQIRQSEPGLCPICEMDLIPAGSNESNDPLVLEMTEEAVKLANIQTTIIGQIEGQTGKTLRLSGKVKEDERMASSQVAHVPGRIEKLYVTFTGESVKKGQKLADMYSPELITAQRELLEATKLKDLNPGLVKAARNKLKYWKFGEEVIKGIEERGEIMETFSIYADEAGIVTKRRVAVGDHLMEGEALFDLMNLSQLWILFDAYEENLKDIAVGDAIEFTTPSVPNRTFKTRITFVDPLINPTTRVASIRAEIDNSRGLLKPEMFVTGTLKNRALIRTQLTVPKSAVLWTGKRSVVYVKVPDMEIPSFQFRAIEISESLGENYVVKSGLQVGEEVVTYGSFTIDAAAQLNNQTSMMNQNVKIKKEVAGVPNFQEETPSEFKIQLNNLANAYIQLKDAFVSTDTKGAGLAAKKVLEQLDAIDMSLLEGEAHIYWMEQLNALKAHSQKISEMEDVEEQRRQFGFISEAMIYTIEAFGTEGETLYVQYCPMAFDNEGADWLSLEEEIRNPYFGDKMMKCGSVKRTLSGNN